MNATLPERVNHLVRLKMAPRVGMLPSEWLQVRDDIEMSELDVKAVLTFVNQKILLGIPIPNTPVTVQELIKYILASADTLN